MTTCCRLAKLCVSNHGKEACEKELGKWVTANRDKFECAAYLVTVACLGKMLLTGKDAGGNPLSKNCCQVVKNDAAHYYGRAQNTCFYGAYTRTMACPFDGTGKIVRPIPDDLDPWVQQGP